MKRSCVPHRKLEAGRGVPAAGDTPPSGHKFSGDINGLEKPWKPFGAPFWLASLTCFLYPVGPPRMRAAPAVILAGLMIRKGLPRT